MASMMTRENFNKALRDAPAVFVGVDFYDGQGGFIPVTKEALKRFFDAERISAKWSIKAEVDKRGDLYIG